MSISKESTLSYDVAVVGAGVTGLMLTRKLAELGLKTALIERADRLAEGPSTRNEGWLHRGTYHATSIRDRDDALQVARRCIYGHEQIKNFAPEAIEDIGLPSFALTRNPDRVDEIVSRWDEAGVLFRRIPSDRLARLEPSVKVDGATEVFQVQDLGINTRLLYRKLLTACENAGAFVMTGANLQFDGSHEATVRHAGDIKALESKLYVHTSGYGVRDFFKANFDTEIPLRYWKSHLMVTPRLTTSSVFCLDPNEAAMMNHGRYSIVGLNEDATVVDTPDYNVIGPNVSNLHDATNRLFANVSDASFALACLKTDLVEKMASARSLNISVSEPLADHLCVLPGKMTEAPYVTDIVTQMVYNRIDDEKITLRPMDIIDK